MYSDVIAAISTPLGKGGVALVRVSGRGAVAIVEKIFFPRSKKALSDYPARFAVYGELRDSRSLIDTCLVTRFEAPASFTGEELVEISCHGGWIVTTMVLETVLGAGARMAEAGEFTRRAFVNDKVTLTEAEAIGDLLSAVSREGVRMSSSQATGALSERMKGITDSLVALISSLYAYIDYPDEDLEDVDDETLSGALSSITSDCERLASTFRAGNAIAHGVPTVIVGKPNVGKSSLFNMLVGEARAIVTDIPGTTRDVLETVVDVEGVALRLFDTAGMRSVTSDVIEEIGINSARERALSPDTSLILALFDTSRPFEADDEALVALLSGQRDKTVIPVFSKTDLPSLLDRRRVEELLGGGVEISSVSDTGADALKREIFKSYVGDTLPSPNEAHLTGLRQHTSLVRGIETLRSAALELSSGMKDMVGMTLERALSELLEVDARSASEMIVNEIFSKFCVGK